MEKPVDAVFLSFASTLTIEKDEMNKGDFCFRTIEAMHFCPFLLGTASGKTGLNSILVEVLSFQTSSLDFLWVQINSLVLLILSSLGCSQTR